MAGDVLFLCELLAGCSPGAVPVPIFSWRYAGALVFFARGDTRAPAWPLWRVD
jgi:hypothetical protein